MTRSLFQPARLLALLSVVAVLVLVFLQWSDPSPGPLAAVHARDAGLESSAGCAICHGDEEHDLAAACLHCHGEIRDQRAKEHGLHGALEPALFVECGKCHAEHRGEDFALVSPVAFALAGVADRARYDHAHVAFTLEGAHRGLACKACHARADEALLPAGTLRFLGLEQRCASCHEDPHRGTLPDCASCHGQERPFAEVASFAHDERFPLEGSHASVHCTACHEKGSERSFEALSAKGVQVPLRSCGDCHPSSHAASFLSSVAARSGNAAPENTCQLCHAVAHEGFAEVPEERMRELHASSGFALQVPHAGLRCEQCHAAPAGQPASFAVRYPGRLSNDCSACHGDPHAGQFERGAFAGSSCTDCHASSHFAPSRVDVAMHARAAFPLEGRHAEAQCTACHPADPQGVLASRVFASAPNECAACHADPHRGQFDVRAGAPGCAHCHDAQTFARSHFDLSAHARTAFPLSGQHAEIACALCHVAREGSTTAGDRVFAGTATQCSACHLDPHRGQFGAPGAASTDCARCHDTTSFRRSAFSDEEHARAGFAISGAHRAVSCERCHVEVETPQGAHRRFRGTPHACAACHDDVHGGRFERAGLPTAVSGRSGCARCHDTQSFRAVEATSFDHALWTGHALVGAHARASCEQCHVPDRDPHAPRRLGFAGTACADCHADPHAGQFRVQGATDCARCHEEGAARFSLRTGFDHDRDTRFVLDASHGKLACSACHVSQKSPGSASVVRYKPLGTRCEDCHATPKRGGENGR